MKTIKAEKGEREELEEGLVLLEDESVILRVRGRSPEEEDQEEANLSLVSRARQRSTSCSRARPPFCRSLFEKEKRWSVETKNNSTASGCRFSRANPAGVLDMCQKQCTERGFQFMNLGE